MISSNADLGGGPKQMFMLGENLNNYFEVFYAIPKSNNFQNFLNKKNNISISQRSINLIDIVNLIKFVRHNSIDIIHAHGKGAGVLSRITNLFVHKKLVYTFHGIHVECHSYLTNFIYLIYERMFGKLDTHKIFVGESEKIYAKNLSLILF